MMRVLILTNLGRSEFPETPFLEGEEHEVDNSLGAKLVKRKLATDITPPPPEPEPTPVLGVAETPELLGVPDEPQSVAEPVAPAKNKKAKGE